MAGRQMIKCAVKSCKYHDMEGKCGLNSIQVAPDASSPKVKSADQSMCSSFECLEK